MRHNRIIYTFFILSLAVFSLVGCNKDKAKVIDKSDMAKIIADLYLADQILEEGTEKRVQADTMLVYMPIIEKYGYTLNDYKKSIEYYLQKDDTYKKLHIKAKGILSDRARELKKVVDAARKTSNDNTPIYWQARTDVFTTPNNELINDPFLRAFKWLAMQDIKIKWNVLDTTVTDSPKNVIWWLNNLSAKHLTFRERILLSSKGNEESSSDTDNREKIVKTIAEPIPLSSRKNLKKQKPRFVEPDENTAKEMREKELEARKLELEKEIIEKK